jgi:hypothetical protein
MEGGMRKVILFLAGLALISAYIQPISAQSPKTVPRCQDIAERQSRNRCLEQAGVPVLDCEQPRSAAEDSLCRRYFNDDRDNRANQPDHERRNAPGQGPLAQPRANTPLLSLLTGSEPLQPQNEPDNLLLNTTLTIAVLIFIITVLRLPRFRQICLQIVGAGLCIGLAYYLFNTERPFEQLSIKLHGLNHRLETERSELETNLAAAQTRRDALEAQDAESKTIDWTKPVYTRQRAIICPLSLFDDPSADHDLDAIRTLWTSIWNRSDKVRGLGCEEWRDGVRVIARLAFPDQRNSIVIINESLFTQQFDLRN